MKKIPAAPSQALSLPEDHETVLIIRWDRVTGSYELYILGEDVSSETLTDMLTTLVNQARSEYKADEEEEEDDDPTIPPWFKED